MTERENDPRWNAGTEMTRRRFLGSAARTGIGIAGLTLLGDPARAYFQNTGVWASSEAEQVLGRPAVYRNGNDKLEVFVRSQGPPQNGLWSSVQNDVNGQGGFGGWDQYKDAKIIRSPSVATASNGDVFVALVASDQKGRMAVRRKGGSWKTAWVRLPHFTSALIAGEPFLTPLADDELGYFIRTTNNYVYFRRLLKPETESWSAWSYAPFAGASNIIAQAQEDGSTAAFGRTTNNKLASGIIHPNKAWTFRVNLSPEFEGNPAVGRNSDGRLTVFLIGRNGNNDPVLFYRTQKNPNEAFAGDTDWEEAAGIHVRGTAAVGQYANKKLAVFSRADDGKIYLKVQKEADGDYEDWRLLDSEDVKFNDDPVVGVNENGSLELFARGNDAKLYHTRQDGPNGDFIRPA